MERESKGLAKLRESSSLKFKLYERKHQPINRLRTPSRPDGKFHRLFGSLIYLTDV